METVLIVDDEPANLAILRDALMDSYRVLAALGGAKALEIALGENPPGLVLLDVNMPPPDGFEVCRRIRSSRKGADIPIIFVSAAGDIHSKT
jgi:CheY-like chemotaxis protein